MSVVQEAAASTRTEIEVKRLKAELADRYDGVPADDIERQLRAEFERRAGYPVQDFVPVFVERSMRRRLHEKQHIRWIATDPELVTG